MASEGYHCYRFYWSLDLSQICSRKKKLEEAHHESDLQTLSPRGSGFNRY